MQQIKGNLAFAFTYAHARPRNHRIQHFTGWS